MKITLADVSVPENSDCNCVAEVAKAVFNCSLQEFYNFVGSEPPYSDMDFLEFALSKGYIVGAGLCPDSYGISQDTQLKFTMKDVPCYIVTKGNAYEHAIYWDGEKVHDSNPFNKGKNLEDYKIYRIFPILRISK